MKTKTKFEKLTDALNKQSFSNYVENCENIERNGITYLKAEIKTDQFINLSAVYPLCAAFFLKDINANLIVKPSGTFLYLCFNQDIIK